MANKAKKVKVKILKPVFGKFLLPYRPGQTPEIDGDVAAEIIKSGYGEAVAEKAPKAKKAEKKPDADKGTPEPTDAPDAADAKE